MKTIGILGGMGSYATCDIFHRILDAFPAEREWERPRILIDNNCTMPSRVRAILYGERTEQLIREMSVSVESLIHAGADKIFLGCMTAHYFRDQLPHQEKILDGLAETNRWILSRQLADTQIFCLCTEGSAQAGIWEKALPDFEIRYPDEEGMRQLRDFIEAVKQNRTTGQTRERFAQYINAQPGQYVLLGCTELPVLMQGAKAEKEVIDPITCVIEKLKKEL